MTVLQSYVPRGVFNITPNDGTDLPQKAYGIYVSGAGDLHYISEHGDEDTVTLAAGDKWIIVVKKVYSTGTTATGIKGFKY